MSEQRPTKPYPDISWWGWGDPAKVPELPEAVRTLLAEGLGVRGGPDHPASLDELTVPAPRLPAELFGSIVGAEHVQEDSASRIRHTRGKSTPDLLRLRDGDLARAPDLVVLPGSHDEVLSVLRVCSERRIAVVPFGGGTSVVGGLEPEAGGFEGVIAVDLRRLNALTDLDETSRIAVLEPGLRGPEAEALLGARGYTLGHFPQSFAYATIGGFAATRSSGQASAGYGRFDDMVVSVRAATPAGTLELGRAPKSAAGPDLRQLLLGSEGALGIITSVGLAVRPLPETRVYEGWRLESFRAGVEVLRRLAQDGPLPTVLRLSDEAETIHLNIGRPDAPGGPDVGDCLAIVGYEGSAEDVRERQARVAALLAAAGLVPGAGEQWANSRYSAPYLRDALLDAGALVETLETASFWAALPDLYAAVASALRESLTAQGTPPVVMCHVSHVYPTGASLYFTVACAQATDPVAQWREAKAAASGAILAAGGSITHHHAVGTDHRPWYEQEVGRLGTGVLRAVKAELDPQGIMNPGVLIPRD
jgi:alkyldihydroxyacetonephosphate synthase